MLNIEAARAQYQITRAGLFPTLDGTGTGNTQRLPAGVSNTGSPFISRDYNVGLSASWELDLFGRIQSLKDQALAQYLNIEAARAQYQITRAGLFPTLDGTGTGNTQRLPAGVSNTGSPFISRDYNVGLSASWELDLFGRIQSLKDQALAQYLSTAQARKAAEISLISQVADQYLTLQS
ncbi:TolC family protein, partial [Burkholderia gladioli]|uniref:TolC family protein n=1 Tax=Burkholderia gladioli TaxID=28095 RepID=UPI001E5FACC0